MANYQSLERGHDSDALPYAVLVLALALIGLVVIALVLR